MGTRARMLPKMHCVSPVQPKACHLLPCKTKGGSLPRSVPLCTASRGHLGPLPLAQREPQNRHGGRGKVTCPVTKPGPKGQTQRHSRGWGLQRGLLGPDPSTPAFTLDPQWAQARRLSHRHRAAPNPAQSCPVTSTFEPLSTDEADFPDLT